MRQPLTFREIGFTAPQSFRGAPQAILCLLPLQQPPRACHEQHQLPQIDFVVWRLFVPHAGHRHNPFTLENGHVYVAQFSQMLRRAVFEEIGRGTPHQR